MYEYLLSYAQTYSVWYSQNIHGFVTLNITDVYMPQKSLNKFKEFLGHENLRFSAAKLKISPASKTYGFQMF